MARKADTPCAGGCGKLLWIGTGSTDHPVCRACRREQAARICEQCGRKFWPRSPQKPRPEAPQRFCSLICVAEYRRIHEDPRTQRIANNRRRRAIHAATWDQVPDQQIYQRDSWICQICETPIQPDLRYPEPLSPSIDHITPLSLGGADNAPNKRATHLICNIRRGNRL